MLVFGYICVGLDINYTHHFLLKEWIFINRLHLKGMALFDRLVEIRIFNRIFYQYTVSNS